MFLLYRSFTCLFVYMVDYIDGFLYVEPSLHPWDEAYLIMVDDFSDVFLDLICQYFIEYFCINIHEEDCFFLIDISPQFDYFLAGNVSFTNVDAFVFGA
ncbi:hypothetical protein H671_5g14947 [Cricetulus griseus]|uniref:Uncharacterized protein n=1 Tax=Cricetulus griseus TaxID=10029 RepID=A0A061I023_CRIGR|nr:hypothetical protein H671_5g14947 [Cricetulus griseus]